MTTDPVRDALADLAPLAPADDAAFAGVRRAVARRRRRRTAGRIVAAVVAVGLIAGGGLAAAGLRDEEGGLSIRPPTRSSHVSFGRMSFELPEGWEVISRQADESMCIGPAGNPYPRYDECSGLLLYHGDPLPGFEMDEYQDHGPWGWYHHTDVAPCPDRPYEPGASFNGIQATSGYDPIESRDLEVGGRDAAWDRWAAGCEQMNFLFQPQGWHVPEAQLLIVAPFEWEEAASILDSIRWRS